MDDSFFDHPILNSPYEYPTRHWELDAAGQPTQRIIESRRRAEFITPIPKPKRRRGTFQQGALLFDEGKGLTSEVQQYDHTAIGCPCVFGGLGHEPGPHRHPHRRWFFPEASAQTGRDLTPTNKQRTFFARACGVARFAWNWALDEWKHQYEADEKPNEAALRRQLNAIEADAFPWMLEVPKSAPQQAIKDLGAAFGHFFRRVKAGQKPGYPRFKKRGLHDSFRADNGPPAKGQDAVAVGGRRVRIPKLGWVRMRPGDRPRLERGDQSGVIREYGQLCRNRRLWRARRWRDGLGHRVKPARRSRNATAIRIGEVRSGLCKFVRADEVMKVFRV